MATIIETSGTGKLNFPGPIGTKRRRMRSGGNVSTLSNNAPKHSSNNSVATTDSPTDDVDDEKTCQTSKCKGSTTIPIFLKKTYKMIETCDPSIASWTEDGDMFVVKDPDMFASQVIPQYFDHNKFSSFARQLNFYGFRKMQSKPIRNSDYDAGTAKHVTFYNENFKRGRCDLLKKIQRSTRGGGTNPTQDHQRDIQFLREQVSMLEQKVSDMESQWEDRVRRLELDMLARMEQMMVTLQQQQQAQLQLQTAASVGTQVSSNGSSSQAVLSQGPMATSTAPAAPPVVSQPAATHQAWEPNTLAYPRGSSAASGNNSAGNSVSSNNNMLFQMPRPPPHASSIEQNVPAVQAPQQAAPTLPPHPKQKQLPMNIFPGSMGAPPDRLNSLRGISQLSRGISGLTRGASIESTASAILMRSSWEDKLFSMLMLDGADQQGNYNGHAQAMNGFMQHQQSIGMNSSFGLGMNNTSLGVAASMSHGNPATSSNVTAPVTVSDRSIDMNRAPPIGPPNHDDLSSVSSTDMP